MACSNANLRVTVLLMPAIMAPFVMSQLLDETTTLYSDLRQNYNKEIRPFQTGRTRLKISIDFSLSSLQNFDDLTGLLKLTSSLSMRWTDPRLTWNTSLYSDLSTIVMAARDIWTPEFVTLNAPDHDYLPGQNAKRARIFNDGTVLLQSFDYLEVMCNVDVVDYPYDTQSCTIVIIPWGYASREVMFHINNDTSFDTHISPLYLDSSAWIVTQPEVSITTVSEFSGIEIFLSFTRRYAYVIANLIIPVYILSFLNTWVFLLPPESGERISFSITVFLSFAVYMTILSDHMPKGSDPLANLNYQMIIVMLYSVSILFCTIVSLRIYNNMDKKKVPRYLAKIVRILSFRNFCTAESNVVGTEYDRRESHDVADYRTLSETINAQFPHINNQRRVSLSRQGTVQKLQIVSEDDGLKDNYKTKMTAGEDETTREITWLDVGLAFDFYMFVVHSLWWVALVVLQSVQSDTYQSE